MAVNTEFFEWTQHLTPWEVGGQLLGTGHYPWHKGWEVTAPDHGEDRANSDWQLFLDSTKSVPCIINKPDAFTLYLPSFYGLPGLIILYLFWMASRWYQESHEVYCIAYLETCSKDIHMVEKEVSKILFARNTKWMQKTTPSGTQPPGKSSNTHLHTPQTAPVTFSHWLFHETHPPTSGTWFPTCLPIICLLTFPTNKSVFQGQVSYSW
jgi:hypothetical protein